MLNKLFNNGDQRMVFFVSQFSFVFKAQLLRTADATGEA